MLDGVKDVAQIIYYITLSIAGPLALIEFLKARKADRRANEYKIYDELNGHFFEYQKIALEYYDLDILDVPNNDPSLAFDKKRKQEMVAHAMLFSLFERAFLMFYQQEDQFRLRQWSGWKHFLNDFIRRGSVRSAWQISRETYDTDFQKFMDAKIAEVESAVAPLPAPVLPPQLTTAPQAVVPESPMPAQVASPVLPQNPPTAPH
ncbi:MAG: hypothetical protein C0467_20515 [Planctomycetaceae bacterium]|nr:hypothetical protein [Planctomycetaceae bacterium]